MTNSLPLIVQNCHIYYDTYVLLTKRLKFKNLRLTLMLKQNFGFDLKHKEEVLLLRIRNFLLNCIHTLVTAGRRMPIINKIKLSFCN